MHRVGLFTGGVDHPQEIVGTVSLIRALVLRYCLASTRREGYSLAQADAITKGVCTEVERDLASRPDLASSLRLPGYVYRATRRHVDATLTRGRPETDEGKAVRTCRDDAAMSIALTRLTDIEFEVFVLRAIVGLSVALASTLLGVRTATLRQLQHSALRTLRHNGRSIRGRPSVPLSVPADLTDAGRGRANTRTGQSIIVEIINHSADQSDDLRSWWRTAQPCINFVRSNMAAAEAWVGAVPPADVVVVVVSSAGDRTDRREVERLVEAGRRTVVYAPSPGRSSWAAECMRRGALASIAKSDGHENLQSVIRAGIL